MNGQAKISSYAWALPVAIGALILFGLGWGFFDCHHKPMLGWMHDHGIKFSVAFAVSAAVAFLSVGLILLVKPHAANF